MDPVLGALITGLFGGAGATLLWELVLKPTRDQVATPILEIA